MSENAEITVKKVNGVPFQKGFDPRRNLKGRPEGSVGFNTIWDQAVERIAEEQHISKEEAEVELLIAAYKQAKNGNSAYFKEIMDRKFGKAEGSGVNILNQPNITFKWKE